MIEVVQQECVIGLTLRSQTIICITRVVFLIGRLPLLAVWGIRHYGIDTHRSARTGGIRFVVQRPVIFQGVCISNLDVTYIYTAHDKVHTGQVVGVLFEFLSVIHYGVVVAEVFGCALTYGNQQRTRTAGRVIDRDCLTVFQVIGNNFSHQLGHFVRRIEFTGFLTGIGGKVTDEILINKAENIVVLLAVHGDIFNQLNKFTDCL